MKDPKLTVPLRCTLGRNGFSAVRYFAEDLDRFEVFGEPQF